MSVNTIPTAAPNRKHKLWAARKVFKSDEYPNLRGGALELFETPNRCATPSASC